MKLSKQILEAVNRGIQLALDDFENIEDNNYTASSDIIDVEDIIRCKMIYKKYLPAIIRTCEKSLAECISYENYFKFVDAVNKLHIKVKLALPGTFGDYQFKQIVQHIIFGLVDKYKNIDLNWIDTSKVTNMSYLLANFPGNVDVSEWNVSSVINMDGLFAGSNFNGDLSKWNIVNVKNMNSMFSNSKFNNDSIKNWNVSNVDNMQLMFMESKFNQNINNWHWHIHQNCQVTAMFSRSKMELKNIPSWLKKRIINQTVNGLK